MACGGRLMGLGRRWSREGEYGEPRMGGPDGTLGACSTGEELDELRCGREVRGSGDEDDRKGPLLPESLTPSGCNRSGPSTGALLGPSPSLSPSCLRSTFEVVILGSRVDRVPLPSRESPFSSFGSICLRDEEDAMDVGDRLMGVDGRREEEASPRVRSKDERGVDAPSLIPSDIEGRGDSRRGGGTLER